MNISTNCFTAAQINDFQDLFCCPISGRQMNNPTVDPCGHIYDQTSIHLWIQKEKCCPLNKRPCTADDLSPEYEVAEGIEAFSALNPQTSAKKIKAIQSLQYSTKIIMFIYKFY